MNTWLAASSTSASPARNRRAAVWTALRTTSRYSRANRSHACRPPASSSRTASLPSTNRYPPAAVGFYRLPPRRRQLKIDRMGRGLHSQNCSKLAANYRINRSCEKSAESANSLQAKILGDGRELPDRPPQACGLLVPFLDS